MRAGFLVTRWSKGELRKIEHSGGVFYLFKNTKQQVIAFALVSKSREFFRLYSNSQGALQLKNASQLKDCRFIEQIGVKRSEQGAGYGALLVKAIVARSKTALFTDTLLTPVVNHRSAAFFLRLGFMDFGRTTIFSYRDSGELKTRVFILKKPGKR